MIKSLDGLIALLNKRAICDPATENPLVGRRVCPNAKPSREAGSDDGRFTKNQNASLCRVPCRVVCKSMRRDTEFDVIEDLPDPPVRPVRILFFSYFPPVCGDNESTRLPRKLA